MPVNGRQSVTEILSITATLGAAELLAFAGGAIQVVPPPGGGQILLPIYGTVLYEFNTVDFSALAVVGLDIHGTGISMSGGLIPSFIGLGASKVWQSSLGVVGLPANDVAPFINQGLDLVLVSGSFALHGVGAASVTAGGTGYAIGDTGTITTGNGDATYRVLTVSGLGAVLTFAITFPGSGYATGAGQATATGGAQPGVGINFTINVTSLVNGDGSIKVTTLYQVIDVP